MIMPDTSADRYDPKEDSKHNCGHVMTLKIFFTHSKAGISKRGGTGAGQKRGARPAGAGRGDLKKFCPGRGGAGRLEIWAGQKRGIEISDEKIYKGNTL